MRVAAHAGWRRRAPLRKVRGRISFQKHPISIFYVKGSLGKIPKLAEYIRAHVGKMRSREAAMRTNAQHLKI